MKKGCVVRHSIGLVLPIARDPLVASLDCRSIQQEPREELHQLSVPMAGIHFAHVGFFNWLSGCLRLYLWPALTYLQMMFTDRRCSPTKMSFIPPQYGFSPPPPSMPYRSCNGASVRLIYSGDARPSPLGERPFMGALQPPPLGLLLI